MRAFVPRLLCWFYLFSPLPTVAASTVHRVLCSNVCVPRESQFELSCACCIARFLSVSALLYGAWLGFGLLGLWGRGALPSALVAEYWCRPSSAVIFVLVARSGRYCAPVVLLRVVLVLCGTYAYTLVACLVVRDYNTQLTHRSAVRVLARVSSPFCRFHILPRILIC